MRMTIDNINMVGLLPKFMQSDDSVNALSKAMDMFISESGSRVKQFRKWDQIDNMSDVWLDEMAWELNADWWDSSFDIDRKRILLKMCYHIHKARGTKWAVEELIHAVFGGGEVIEWFEYGGSPFYFKIKLNAALTESGMKGFASMINKVKNVRSHIENIEIVRSACQELHAGISGRTFSNCIILENNEIIKSSMKQELHAGINGGIYSRYSILENNEIRKRNMKQELHAGMSSKSNSRCIIFKNKEEL